MKASYNWLRTLVPQLSVSPEELAEALTRVGLEVEGISHFGRGAEHCLVVAVKAIEPHPSKSGLRLVTVDLGGRTQTVVCGAPNVPEPGGLVVLAPLGTTLPAKNMVIEPRAIGGIVSEGMLCSEAELGIGPEGDGILVLPKGSATPGAPLLAAVPEASDSIFEIGLTPNRPDGLGHVGLAREIAAIYKHEWERPTPPFNAHAEAPAIEALGGSVAIEAPERCSHFATAAVIDVQVGPSPLWLRYRLASLGVRSISNVVDVTNLVMLEWGHPMHAYDLDRLHDRPATAELAAGGKLSVRHAREGEVLVTLDGQSRSLDVDDLVIADGAGAVGLAGVMGGQSSEVSVTTKRLLLESAVFEPRGVRRTARRHGMHSEASHRFERGVDATDGELVLASAAGWLSRLTGGKVARGVFHAGGGVHFPRTVTLRRARLTALLGHEVPWAEARGNLARLGLTLTDESAEAATFELPAHRPDLTREADLIEEVLRLHGIDAIPARLPRIPPTRDVGSHDGFLDKVRAAAVALGLSEALSFALTSQSELDKVGASSHAVVLENPLTQDANLLTTSLVPGLLDTLRRARRHGVAEARLFTARRIFLKQGPGELPEERLALVALLGGERAGWLQKPRAYDAWDAKGLALALVEAITGSTPEVVATASERLHPRARAALQLDGVEVGAFGLLHPDLAEHYDLGGEPTVMLELDLEQLRRRPESHPRYRTIPRFPANVRDLALVVREGLPAGEVESVVRERAAELADDVVLFDRYVGAGVAEGHVSLAFRIVYRRPDRTLTDAEVDVFHGKVVEDVSARFGAALRG